MRTAPFFALLLAAPLACRPPDTSAAAKAAIDSANAHWAHLTAAGRADSLAGFYHAQAVLYPPNMPAVRGRDSIRAFFAVLDTMSSPPPLLALRAESVWAMGPSAVELGRWTFTWPAGVDSGTYLVRWVREDGRWLMMQDIWNSDVPLPAAPQ
ncbi:MAG: YybH family protein [Gemmatimonadales bacterium]